MDDPNITMEDYIRLEKEKAQRHCRTFNWQIATFGKVENYEDEDDCFIDFETEFPATVFDNTLTALPSEPTVCPLNENKIDFRISLDESDDEDYMVIFDENSFSYKIISVNDLKSDSGNDNDNMPSSPNLLVDYCDDLDFFKDFENEFPAIVYSDAQTSKLDYLTEPILNPQHIDEFNLNDETSLSEYDEDEQNVLHFNDLFLFDIIHPDDLKMSDTKMGLDVVDTLCFQLGGVRKRMTWRQFILALGLHTEQEMAEVRFGAYWDGSDRLIPDKGDLRAIYGSRSHNDRDFLGPAPSYVLIRDLAAATGAHGADEVGPAAEEGAQEIPAPAQAPPPPSLTPQP
ncbi:hypothetical protein Tco_0492861 [Tanacetum coccineum]